MAETDTARPRSRVIAIDGPAASGKGTIARRLAAHFGFRHLDTGLLYRAVGLKMQGQIRPLDPTYAAKQAEGLTESDLANPALRSAEAGELASIVAAIPEVREALLAFQRRFASHPPGGAPGAVLDGRDIGEVICPDADVKLFVTASLPERARRRAAELRQSDPAIDEQAVRDQLRERDRRDAQREAAPMRQAADAILLDTDSLDIDTAVAKAISIVADRLSH